MDAIDQHIKAVLDWTEDKLQGQQEPPWATQQYEELRAALVATLRARSATVTLEDLRGQEPQPESDPPQAENIVELDTARLRRGMLRLQMPM